MKYKFWQFVVNGGEIVLEGHDKNSVFIHVEYGQGQQRLFCDRFVPLNNFTNEYVAEICDFVLRGHDANWLQFNEIVELGIPSELITAVKAGLKFRISKRSDLALRVEMSDSGGLDGAKRSGKWFIAIPEIQHTLFDAVSYHIQQYLRAFSKE